jgi:hypothetical protein
MSVSSIAAWPLQEAVYERLAGHSATKPFTVTDTADAAYPYIALGATFGSGADTKTTRGSNEVVQVDVWARNSKVAKTMMQAVDAALAATRLDLESDGFKALAEPTLDDYRVMTDYDDARDHQIRHAVMRYRFMISSLND